jgi:hypothetical protein
MGNIFLDYFIFFIKYLTIHFFEIKTKTLFIKKLWKISRK